MNAKGCAVSESTTMTLLSDLERAARELREIAADESLSWTTSRSVQVAYLLDRARAEIQGLQKDAARYRWLREQHHGKDHGLWVAHGVIGTGLAQFNREPLDEAIDRAADDRSSKKEAGTSPA